MIELKNVDGFAHYKKVPFREVYCDSWGKWIAAVLRCHLRRR